MLYYVTNGRKKLLYPRPADEKHLEKATFRISKKHFFLKKKEIKESCKECQISFHFLDIDIW